MSENCERDILPTKIIHNFIKVDVEKLMELRNDHIKQIQLRKYKTLKSKVETILQHEYAIKFQQNQINQQLIQESQNHQDIIFLDMIDSYANLTLKTLQGFSFIAEFSPAADYIMKIDDDSYMKIENLFQKIRDIEILASQRKDRSVLGLSNAVLKNSHLHVKPKFSMENLMAAGSHLLNPEPEPEKPIPPLPQNIYLGHLKSRSGVKRDPWNKWHETKYQGSMYPSYMNGCSGYVISREMALWIQRKNEQHRLTKYHNEDASLGIWLSQDPYFKKKVKYIDFMKEHVKEIY